MEGNKKFLKKRNRDNSKNRSRNLKRNFSKDRGISQRKRGFGVKFKNNNNKFANKKYKKNDDKNFDNFDDDLYNLNNNQGLNKKDDVIKIAKYWEPKQIIEPINTQGKLVIWEENKYLFSIVGNELKILDLFTHALIKAFNQVRILIIKIFFVYF